MEALTPRQLELLALFGNGLRGPEIAAKCFITIRTVEHTIQNARKNRAETTVQLLCMAIADEQLILDHDGAVRVPA
jgi:DNA-binding CsgD family transcriptional regulator